MLAADEKYSEDSEGLNSPESCNLQRLAISNSYNMPS